MNYNMILDKPNMFPNLDFLKLHLRINDKTILDLTNYKLKYLFISCNKNLHKLITLNLIFLIQKT